MDNFVPIIAVCVAIIGILLRLKRKGFSYYIESANAVVSVEEKVADQVKIFIGKTQVENVHLIVMKIWNSGNQSIRPDDFINNVILYFGDNSIILSGSIVETEPLSLDPRFEVSPHSLDPRFHLNIATMELFPLLLNSGDNMIFNFLVSNWDPDALEVHGRIVGVKDIKLEGEASGVSKIFALLTGIFIVTAVILMNLRIITLIQGAYIAIFSYFLLVISIFTSRKNIKRYRAYIRKIRSYVKW